MKNRFIMLAILLIFSTSVYAQSGPGFDDDVIDNPTAAPIPGLFIAIAVAIGIGVVKLIKINK